MKPVTQDSTDCDTGLAPPAACRPQGGLGWVIFLAIALFRQNGRRRVSIHDSFNRLVFTMKNKHPAEQHSLQVTQVSQTYLTNNT